ncbi:MAG: siroheme synthase CysG [Pseudomonadota bacterium]
MSSTLSLPSKPRAVATLKRRRPERVGELAVLPVFYKLRGKKVVLAGGSDAAAWKGELLAASGAVVHVYAEELDPAFVEVMEAAPGCFVHHARPWAADCFEHAVIAIADAETDGEAQAFYCTARAAGVAVNVIDKPAFCEFQFGSIVNRSPAVVSISTDGAAPIFGQAIRRRIETVLPASVQEWARLAQRVRAQVNARLDFGAPRRQFWERFVNRAFSSDATAVSEQDVLADVERIAHAPDAKSGRVTLVGAGPGDAELLTLKAMRALQAADVILFDDLVSSEVLELARREAKRMLVGKRGGRNSCKQDDINATLLKLAKAGKNVVRLKSGDPVIFGRAGEELSFLEQTNIPVTIVPGITAASAMASHLGVSLTHRDHARSVRYITGHSRHGHLPADIDWQAVAQDGTTNIFYMAGRTAKQLQSLLMDHGMAPSTPVVIASNISRADQAQWAGSLETISHGIDVIGFKQPVLIGIGPVFGSTRVEALPGDGALLSATG